MERYRVKDWDGLYENSRSREVDVCSFVCVPNKQHGAGFIRIMAEKDGAAIYGVFNLIIGACSRQRRHREGWLTDDGKATGSPWTVGDMALWWRRTVAEIKRALDILSSKSVSWLEVVAGTDVPTTADELPNNCRSSTLNGMEGKEENGKKEECGEPLARQSPPTSDPSLVFYPDFPVITKKNDPVRTWTLEEIYVNELAEAFTGVDVKTQCRKSHGWVKAHLSRRKTAKGMKKFLWDWMERENNRLKYSPGQHKNFDSVKADEIQRRDKKAASEKLRQQINAKEDIANKISALKALSAEQLSELKASVVEDQPEARRAKAAAADPFGGAGMTVLMYAKLMAPKLAELNNERMAVR